MISLMRSTLTFYRGCKVFCVAQKQANGHYLTMLVVDGVHMEPITRGACVDEAIDEALGQACQLIDQDVELMRSGARLRRTN